MVTVRCAVSQSTIQRRASCPARNGTSSRSTISPIDAADNTLWPCASTAISTGVSTIPARLENDAEQIAAATFPLAMEASALEDCTVDGAAHSNTIPVWRTGG